MSITQVVKLNFSFLYLDSDKIITAHITFNFLKYKV